MADQIRPKVPKLAANMDQAEPDVLAHMSFPSVGAFLLEQNDKGAVQRAHYMTLETISQMSDDPLVSLPAVPS